MASGVFKLPKKVIGSSKTAGRFVDVRKIANPIKKPMVPGFNRIFCQLRRTLPRLPARVSSQTPNVQMTMLATILMEPINTPSSPYNACNKGNAIKPLLEKMTHMRLSA